MIDRLWDTLEWYTKEDLFNCDITKEDIKNRIQEDPETIIEVLLNIIENLED